MRPYKRTILAQSKNNSYNNTYLNNKQYSFFTTMTHFTYEELLKAAKLSFDSAFTKEGRQAISEYIPITASLYFYTNIINPLNKPVDPTNISTCEVNINVIDRSHAGGIVVGVHRNLNLHDKEHWQFFDGTKGNLNADLISDLTTSSAVLIKDMYSEFQRKLNE